MQAHVLVFYADMPLLEPETHSRTRRKASSHRRNIDDADSSFGRHDEFWTYLARWQRQGGPNCRRGRGDSAGICKSRKSTLVCTVSRRSGSGRIWKALKPSPKKGEYYLTDLLEMAVGQGASVETDTNYDVSQCIGINTRVQLSQAEKIMRERVRERVMLTA